MSNRSDVLGRAYEYACITSLYEAILKIRKVRIEENAQFKNTKSAWDSLNADTQNQLKSGANAIVNTIFDLEPLIVEVEDDILSLQIQQDRRGELGDVRDLLIIRKAMDWEIGLSLKHNHFAVKHSRLSRSIDFGEKWYGIACSNDYKVQITKIFDQLEEYKNKNLKWEDLDNKAESVYIPILSAFKSEINRVRLIPGVPKKLVEYLLGTFDFYKVVSVDRSKESLLYSYNLHGTLNKPSKFKKSKIYIPIVALPTRIVSIEMKPNSDNTIELYLDNGWQFSFRIHNASKRVEPSLKFDIQIIGMPISISLFSCKWV